MLEVLAGEGILFVRESAHEHLLDIRLLSRFLEPLIFEELFARAMSFSFNLIPMLRGSSYRSGAALERPMNLALGIAVRWRSKARLIEPCLTTEFT